MLSADPLPDLLTRSLIRINHEMLADRFGYLVVDFEARWAIRDRRANKGDETALLGYGGQMNDVSVYRNVELRLVVVPPQVFPEQRLEIE